MDEYLKLKRISSHLLHVFVYSVRDFINKFNNPEQEHKKYFELGKQVHMLLLEPNKFSTTYLMSDFNQDLTPATEQQKAFCTLVAADEPIVGAFAKTYKTERKSPKKIEEEASILSTRFKPYIDYLKEINTGKIVLPKSLTDKLIEAKNAIIEHKKAKELLDIAPIEFTNDTITYFNELEILWEFKGEFGVVECKSKPDRVIVDTKNKVIKLIDLKTTSSLLNFKDTVKEYGYDSQLAFYWLAITYWFLKQYPSEKIEEYTQETYIVALKTTGTIECKVFSFSDTVILDKVEETSRNLNTYSWHVANNKWDYPKEYYDGDGVEII